MMARAPTDALTDAQAWTALRRTTEALACQLASPTEDTPDWSEDEWLIARAAAALHGVSALLAGTSRWRGPASWHAFLNEQASHVAERHSRIESLVELLDSRAREHGIPLTALKGTALHAIGLYRPGERPMADVDLLCRPDDAGRTGQMLEQLGFRMALRSWKHDVFELPDGGCGPRDFGEHAANGVKIELHTHVSEQLPCRVTQISEHVFPRERRAGINPYPSQAALLMHVLLHAAGAMCMRALRMINLNDIARLSARMTEADWEEFLALGFRQERALWWAQPPLAITARYYGAIPECVLGHRLLVCPQRLKHIVRVGTITDVSLSNPQLTAFPGIMWSSGVTEALLYMKERVAPDYRMLDAREYMARTAPVLRTSAWARMSQGRRIWKWLMTHPPREDSLYAVRTALAQRSLPHDQCRKASTSA